MDRNHEIKDHFDIKDVVKTRTGVNFNSGSKDNSNSKPRPVSTTNNSDNGIQDPNKNE